MRTRDAAVRELLDGEALDNAALEDNLRDIRFINAFLGWTSYTVRAIERHTRTHNLHHITVLDVASGSADMPLAIARWADRAGVGARIVASDIRPQIVAIARRQIEDAGLSSVTVERLDALALSYAPGSFDVVLCTLALHHFEPESAIALLRSMARVGRQVFVFDVARSRLAYAGAVLLTQALRMNYMTRHDAPASVRRAYSAAELREMAARAGLADARVWVGFPFRLTLAAAGTT